MKRQTNSARLDETTSEVSCTRKPGGLRWACLRNLLLVFLAVATVTSPGCSCREETPAEKAAREKREEEEAEKRQQEEKEKQKKPPLEVQPPIPQPGPEDITALGVKPGHWMIAKQTLKPNYNDWVGEATVQVVDANRQPIPVDRTAFALRSTRDVALSKGQEKDIESVAYVPAVAGALQWRNTLRERGSTLSTPPNKSDLKRLAPHQQHFVVLGKESQRYRYLSSLYAVKAPFEMNFDTLTDGNASEFNFAMQYRVVIPDIKDRIPLPENPLCWTTVAYLLWDEVDPERLNPAQQAALVDWIHWGGQVIISGPDSLDLLAGSFLDPYLPADANGPRKITSDDLKPMSFAWDASRRRDPLTAAVDWSGINLMLRPESKPVAGLGDLFAERPVGRGRIVVSAMQLAERDFINWRGGHENLFNNFLLRRSPRSFKYQAGSGYGNDGFVAVERRSSTGTRIDAAENSTLRMFSRDTHANPNALSYAVLKTEQDTFGGFPQQIGGQQFETNKLTRPAVVGGPGAWSDFNAAATAARESLREAAGVNVPDSSFVMLCLGIYLAVLAPINWLFFRAMGRVELAWVAAPVIALLGTWAVVKQAQLDIGFVRAQSEVAVLETQPDHPRGHLTRYMSFYTSLSTTYDMEFDEPTTLAAPFARSDKPVLRPGDSPTIAIFERQEKARLRGLTVSSNTTDMAHAEQMIDLGGRLTYDPKGRQLTNETNHRFTDLAVVRRPLTGPPVLQGCWVGDLRDRSSTSVSFLPVASTEENQAPFADRRASDSAADPTAGVSPSDQRLNLEPLFALALDPNRMEPGEVRAVGRIEKVFDGVTVTPQASQGRGATFVVAHLQYAPLPKPKSDRNAPMDVQPRR